MELVAEVASRMGLDFLDTCFHLCPSSVLHAIGAWGVPYRFYHWIFGQALERIEARHLARAAHIYELMVPAEPCHAFLVKDGSRLEMRVVAAHVLAHSDFFKHNIYFSHLPQDAVYRFALHAGRMACYERMYGRDKVERILDAALALSNQVRPGFPKKREEDLLFFLAQHSPVLGGWQRDVILMVREEGIYFWPQTTTRIINEGWATYWHTHVIRRLPLTEEEAVEFALLQSSVLAPTRFTPNYYLLGYEIFNYLARRGENIFSVRSLCDDVAFLENYLTADLITRLGLCIYHQGNLHSCDPGEVKRKLIQRVRNGGHPYVLVRGVGSRRELILTHLYENVELDFSGLERTMAQVHFLWGGNVVLETVTRGRKAIITYDGRRLTLQ